jgi:thiol-disulfide isomerase/thioredoxin
MPAASAPAERAGERAPSGWEVKAFAAPKRAAALAGFALIVLSVVAAVTLYNRARTAPPVTFTTLAGERIAADDLHGKVVLVNFWATTCAVCAREMPQMVETHQAYASRGFEVIAVQSSG